MDGLTNGVTLSPTHALRGVARWLLAAALLLVGLAVPAPNGARLAQAALQAGPRAGLVVSFGDGRVQTECIDLGDDGQATGEEILRGAGLTIAADYGSGLGAGVCKIDNVGCSFPAEGCFCQCSLNPGDLCRYWGYSFLEDGEWRFSNRGASTSIVGAGDVQGWAWGEATVGSVAEPPVIPFDEICLTAPTPTATPSPQPTETATLEPTPTETATATPIPTETASATLAPTETPPPSATASPTPTNTAMPSATSSRTASPTRSSTATASRQPATATRTTTPRPASSPTATVSPAPSATPTLRPTWTLFPRSPTPTAAGGGAGGDDPSPTPSLTPSASASAISEPTASATGISTLTVTLPTRTATRPAPTETPPPSATATAVPTLAATPTLADVAVVVATLVSTPAGETLVDDAQPGNNNGYWLFVAMVLVLGGVLLVLRRRQR